MALGSMSYIGLGSGGVLSYDILDKLKAADEKAIISPLEKKIEAAQNKEKVFQNIISKLNDLNGSLFDIAGPTIYNSRKIDVVGNDVDATVLNGAPTQSVNVKVKQLATADINKTKGFAGADSVVTDKDVDMTITIDGQDTTFTVAAGTTLSDLKSQIASEMDGKVSVTLLNTGTGDTPYELILKSAQTGENQQLSFSYDDHDSNTSDDDFLNITNLQKAQDAIVTVDNVDVQRSSNVISDAIPGVTLTLKNVSTSDNKITITQDNEAIADKVQNFVDKYNDVMGYLAEATKYNPDNKEAGVFQGDSTITTVQRQLSTIVMEIAPNGKALNEFGIDVDRYGKMSFDRSKFISALETEPDVVKETFAGTTATPGVLADLKNFLDNATSPMGIVGHYDEYLRNNITSLEEQKKKAMENLDMKYEIMAKQFMAYDTIIAKMNNSFSALASIIDAQAAAAKK